MDILAQKQTTELDTKLGKVKLQVPTLMKRLEIERKRSFYMGGLAYISGTGAELAEIFATLDGVMVECENLKKNDSGAWDFDSLSEFDLEKIQDVYNKAVEWLDSFRKGLGDKQA